jgi:acyl transferase domain-containing protein/NADPH:quinone reductase-like Zn-dependent oxidoreductase/acyl carrier protein/NADP-dependent 3-hydroxy acid dehydrogenase YdfG/SAM-dependent methyltransferase
MSGPPTGSPTIPIAIVGCAFRFPGDLADEASLWRALREGRDMVGTIDAARWATDQLQHARRAEPGRSISFAAGVLSHIDQFDANFFGISPREAAWLDPQQRLLLELTWEALENAGQVPSRLEGSRCGVFVGISGFDYGLRGLDDLASLSGHLMTGNTLSIAANRLSYVFDLRGPSMAVDTACSSSLVALHQACCSLQSGESTLALVGGMNLLLHPYSFVAFTKASMLSARGRCRPFDAGADGYVRAEGGAVLLLKSLDEAERDGDPILAVILGTGANTDGGQKSGMTIPSRTGQAELMRGVMTRAGITPQQVDYIEAHGTGTAVGDPIEASAIGEVYGQGRAAPLPIGSIKSNLGHLEPASGMAGLVKTLLMLKHRALPPTLHFETPNPQIDFRTLNLQVVTEYLHLPKSPRRLPVMGVNSFGFGGANAHALLRAYAPRPRRERSPDAPVPPLFLSARSEEALRALAERYAALLQSGDAPDYYDIAHGSAFRRAHLERRLALRAEDPAGIARLLERFASGAVAADVVLEHALPEPGEIAFVYSGNGAQWAGMGQRLLAESPRFAQLMSELDAAMADAARFSILAALRADAANAHLDDTAVAQPLLFAMQVAITRLLREQGLEPAFATGHSVGEVAAAWAAGALDLEQAIEVICARSAAQALTRGGGRMAAVGLSEQAVRALLQQEGLDSLEIAGINSPNAVTLSGSLVELQLLEAMLEARQVFFRLLDLDYAFHSRAMDPIREQLEASLAGLQPAHTAIPFISTVRGERVDGTALGAGYWWQNIREPVQFAQAVQSLAAHGARVFLEIGPHAILQTYLSESLSAAKLAGRVLPTMRRGNDGLERLEEAALRARLSGCQPDLRAYFPLPGRFVRLPNYPWQRERHWHPVSSESAGVLARPRVHPLLGWRVAGIPHVWENSIDATTLPYLADHRIAGAVVFPAAAYVELALAGAREHFGGERFELEELDILAPIVLDPEHARSVRCEFVPGESVFRIRSRQRLSEDEWSLNAIVRLAGAPTLPAPEPDLSSLEGEALEAQSHYQLAQSLGLQYGSAFQRFERGVLCGDTLRGALLESPEPQAEAGYLLHPAALDACFQSLVHFFAADIATGNALPLLPVKIGRMRYFGGSRPRAFGARVKRRALRSVLADFILLDPQQRVVAVLEDVRFRAATVQRQASAEPSLWQVVPRLTPHPADGAPVPQPANRVLAEIAQASLAALEAPLRRPQHFHDALPLSDALVVAFAYDAFRTLQGRAGAWLEHALEDPQRVGADQRALFLWLRGRLQAAGLLARDAHGWRLNVDLAPPPAEEIFRTLLADFPDNLPELLCVGRVGRRLAALLEGTEDVQALARGIRGSNLIEALVDDAPAYRATNVALAELLDAMMRQWPSERRVRVLEISGGSSELHHRLVARLEPERLDYVIAGPENPRHAHLQAEYAAHPFVSVATLRVEDLSLTAGSPLPSEFDLILVHHWLHGVPQLSAALAGLRAKLAPGGLLLLAERHPDASADLIFGVSPTWWHEAEGGPSSSLMAPRSWEKLLVDCGFEQVETVAEPAAKAARSGAYLVLASNPAATRAREELASAAWLLLCSPDDPSRTLGERLALHLESHSQRVLLSPVRPEVLQRRVEEARTALGGIDHVVYLAGVLGEEEIAEPGLAPDEATGCLDALGIVHAIAGTRATPPRLWLIGTGGAGASRPGNTALMHPSNAPLWGLGRVLMNEQPALGCTLIDVAIDPAGTEAAERLSRELLWPDGENEIVLAEQGRFALRLQRCPAFAAALATTAEEFRLDFRVPGQLRNLDWFPLPTRALQRHEIEVRPMAAGLNFRDVMYAMGLLPDEVVENGFSGASLGLEFAGIVHRVGEDVTDYRPGDEVMGFAPACFASRVITTAGAIARKPPGWSFAQAATVPVAFFTVYYALKHLANLQPGERVLIHGGAGAVGIAAIQLAQHLGAEVIATAGNDEKRDFVHLIGADRVFDSRSLAFADEILALTGGEGVDVVLNSLAGEAIHRNLRALRRFGRYLELGKRDFVENTHIGLRPFKNNISYFGIDADQLLIARPQLACRLFGEVMALFREGVLVPLPAREFSAGRIVDAFRYMQQSRQIGKVVIDLKDARVPVRRPAQTPVRLRLSQDASYLVTGGLSGFGLESARALARRGAGHLVLLCRQGLATPGAEEAIAGLQALGARVHVRACNVADRPALAAVLRAVARELPPVRGVLHAAMVLEDCLIANLDAARLQRVLAPKIQGARNLHELTLDYPLEHFILYSSVTTCLGNPGQANYVAANAYLEALVAWRRSRGLTGTCVAWGPIDDAGYLSRNEGLKDSLAARLGTAPLRAAAALEMLERILMADLAVVTVADLGWPVLSKLLPSAVGPRFDYQRRAAGAGDCGSDATLDLTTLLAGRGIEETRQIVQELVLKEVSQILRLGPERIDPARSLYDLGMDSLMAMELALGIEKRFGINLPAMALNEGPSVERISQRLTARLSGVEAEVTTPAHRIENLVRTIAAQHSEDMSAQEVREIAAHVQREVQTGARLIP